MNTCKTCKWWTRQNDKMGMCEWCDHIKISGGPHINDMAVTTGCKDQDCVGTLYTGPDFGCIHHEPKAVKGAM